MSDLSVGGDATVRDDATVEGDDIAAAKEGERMICRSKVTMSLAQKRGRAEREGS